VQKRIEAGAAAAQQASKALYSHSATHRARALRTIRTLCCSTYLNLHGLTEARSTYSSLEIMYVEYDGVHQTHLRVI
jgi:hypothetical protein